MIMTFASAAATLVFALAAGSAAAAEETQVPPPPAGTLTQADIQADLRAWRESGMAELSRTQDTPDLNDAEYLRRHAEYLRLRGGAAQSAAPATPQRG